MYKTTICWETDAYIYLCNVYTVYIIAYLLYTKYVYQAYYSNTFHQVNSVATQVWKFQRYHLVIGIIPNAESLFAYFRFRVREHANASTPFYCHMSHLFDCEIPRAAVQAKGILRRSRPK